MTATNSPVTFLFTDIEGSTRLWEDEPARETGDRRGIVMELNNLAKEALALGDAARARAFAMESLSVLHELGDRRLVAEALEALAGVAAAEGAPERAARILGCVGRLREEVGYPLRPREVAGHERQMRALRSALGGDGAFDVAMQEGRTMTLERAIEFVQETRPEAR
jgi:class 3 adenylate cyclase